MATARITAMLTYRSRDSFESRFGRKLQPPPKADGSPNKVGPRAVEASGQQGHYNPDQVEIEIGQEPEGRGGVGG